MTNQTNKPHLLILLAVLAVIVLTGILLFISPAAIFPDPSWGLQVLRSMQMGSAFNTLVSPDPANIALNVSEFVSWWSPGQYLLPYLFKTIFNVSTGQALTITTIICQLLGLAGFYCFFKKAGFSKLICALSPVVIVCQQAFFTPCIFYNGGETLLFAFAGWFLYGCLKFNKPGIKLVLFVLISGCVGFICKSSFIWIYAASLLFMWLQLYQTGESLAKWLVKGVWPGIPALLAAAIIYFGYLSKGNNPSSDTAGFKLSWETFTFPIASPLLSGFSVDDLFHGLILHNNTPVLNYAATVVVLLLSATVSLWLVYAICKSLAGTSYTRLLIVLYVASVLFFNYAYLRQMNISYEARHFRIIGLLIIPGALYVFSQFKQGYRIALALVVLVIAVFSINFYVKACQGLKANCAYGASGIAQQFIDQPALNYITMLDKQHHNAVFVFLSADIGLEVQQNRIITLQPLNNDININFDEYIHKGFAGPLYILLPAKYIGIRASVILKCFPGYKGFSLKELSSGYVLYYSDIAR